MALVGNYVRADVNVATLFFQDMLPKVAAGLLFLTVFSISGKQNMELSNPFVGSPVVMFPRNPWYYLENLTPRGDVVLRGSTTVRTRGETKYVSGGGQTFVVPTFLGRAEAVYLPGKSFSPVRGRTQ